MLAMRVWSAVISRNYAHGGRALVDATMVLPVMAATVDEHVRGGDSLKGGHALLQRR